LQVWKCEAFFPEVIGFIGEFCLRVSVSAHEIRSLFNERPEEGFNEFDVPIKDEMVP
jgi:hypothetical protein